MKCAQPLHSHGSLAPGRLVQRPLHRQSITPRVLSRKKCWKTLGSLPEEPKQRLHAHDSRSGHEQLQDDTDCWPDPGQHADGLQQLVEPTTGCIQPVSCSTPEPAAQPFSCGTPEPAAENSNSNSNSNGNGNGNGSSSSSNSTAISSQSISSSRPKQQQQQRQQPWPPDSVPWGLGKVVQVMGLWLLAYIALGQVIVPAIFAVLDIDQGSLSSRGSALLNLALDIGQVAITLGILALCTGKYKPRARGLYRLGWQQGAWIGAVAAGAAMFPAVDWLANSSTWVLSGDGVAGADMWPAQIESVLFERDWLTCGAYLSVISICAPLWEEAIFRGFLLPSLSAQLAQPTLALLGSSLIFAMCHFRMETFAPLMLLGLVFGAVYSHTRNLLPPMVLHSLWNMYVLCTMTLRLRSGLGAPAASLVTILGMQGVLLLMAVVSRPRVAAGAVVAAVQALRRNPWSRLRLWWSKHKHKKRPAPGAAPAVDSPSM